MLTDPTTLPEWEKLLGNRFAIFANDFSLGAISLEDKSRKLKAASARVCANLFSYLDNLHEYVDKALEIEQTLCVRMSAMTSAQFERVLHPIFEEDELTLILAGGGLGFLAGFVQQLFSTGAISFPRFSFSLGTPRLISSLSSVLSIFILSVALKPEKKLFSFMLRLMERTRRLKKRTGRLMRRQKTTNSPGS